jgi:hypothetical protein
LQFPEQPKKFLTTDFSVFGVDFSTPAGYDGVLKQKLDTVNSFNRDSYSENVKKFNLSLPVNEDYVPSLSEDLYTVGFPSSKSYNSEFVRFEKKHVMISSNDYGIEDLISDPEYIALGENDYAFKDKFGDEYYDSGILLRTGDFQGTRGGSSGSLVLNKNNELAAINFAGPNDSTTGIYVSLVNNQYDVIFGDNTRNNGFGNGFFPYLKEKATRV